MMTCVFPRRKLWGQGVGGITGLRDGGLHAAARILADTRGFIDATGNRGDGYPRDPRHVLDRYLAQSLLFLYRFLTNSGPLSTRSCRFSIGC